jgi:hypothetical protein
VEYIFAFTASSLNAASHQAEVYYYKQLMHIQRNYVDTGNIGNIFGRKYLDNNIQAVKER